MGLGGLPPTGFALAGIEPADFRPADFGSFLAISLEPVGFGPVDFGPADFGLADFGPADFGPADFGPAGLGSFPAITFWGLGTLPSILIVWDKTLAAPVEVGLIISSSLSSKGIRLTSCGPVSTRDVSKGSCREVDSSAGVASGMETSSAHTTVEVTAVLLDNSLAIFNTSLCASLLSLAFSYSFSSCSFLCLCAFAFLSSLHSLKYLCLSSLVIFFMVFLSFFFFFGGGAAPPACSSVSSNPLSASSISLHLSSICLIASSSSSVL